MASFSTSHHFTTLTLLILLLKIQAFDSDSSFSFTDFAKDPKFNSTVALYGNAKVVNGGSKLLLSGSGSSGNVMCKKPIKLVEETATELVSFSTYFAFSIPLDDDDDDGLAFVMVPRGFEGEVFSNSSSGFSLGLKERGFKVIGVEFSASNVAIHVGSSVLAKTSNASSFKMGLRSGEEKMHAWIDYAASSRRLEVRLSHYGHSKPSDPILWHSIDFTNLWGTKEMFVGFSSVKKGDSSQPCFLYSWSFVVRHYPHWMHSEPLDPKVLAVSTTKNTETPAVKPRSDCLLRVLAAMIFGAGCGALTAFVGLYLWTIFGNKRPVVPEEYVMQPIDFEYKKVNVVVDKIIKDAKE